MIVDTFTDDPPPTWTEKPTKRRKRGLKPDPEIAARMKAMVADLKRQAQSP